MTCLWVGIVDGQFRVMHQRRLHDVRGGPHPPELGDTGTGVVACVARDGEAGVKGLGVGEWEPSGKAAQELYQLARARSSASYGADSFLATAVIGNRCSYINRPSMSPRCIGSTGYSSRP